MRTAAALAACALLALPLGASADVCSVSSNGLPFGNYDPLAAGDLLLSGNLVVSCGLKGTSAQVTLSAGRSGNASNRTMATAAGYTLSYQLYVDAARTNPWTNDVVRTAKMGNDFKDTVYVYGKVFAGQDAATGSYADALTIGINF